MTIFRIFLYGRAPLSDKAPLWNFQILQILFMGFRFDILVISFLLMPLMLLSYIFFLNEKAVNSFYKFAHFYLRIMWGFVCFLTWVGGLTYLRTLEYLRLGSYSHIFDYLIDGSWLRMLFDDRNLKIWTGGCFILLIVGFVVIIGQQRRLILMYEKKPMVTLGQGRLIPFFLSILPLLGLSFGARGTLAAHHLAFEHCEAISTVKSLQELAINALWAIDKK